MKAAPQSENLGISKRATTRPWGVAARQRTWAIQL
jgi:hypothetical protein